MYALKCFGIDIRYLLIGICLYSTQVKLKTIVLLVCSRRSTSLQLMIIFEVLRHLVITVKNYFHPSYHRQAQPVKVIQNVRLIMRV